MNDAQDMDDYTRYIRSSLILLYAERQAQAAS